MEAPAFLRVGRGRGGISHDSIGGRGRSHSRNKHWSATDAGPRSHTPNNADNERWERGGHRGGGRGRGHSRGIPKSHNVSLRLNNTQAQPTSQAAEVHQEEQDHNMTEEDFDDGSGHVIQEPELETQEERDKFYQELVKAREIEKKKAIAEGKMDDPLVPKRLEDAITIVGTCLDMCPRFERYRRERENNLFEWEVIPGTRRVDHNIAVKMYERGAGDRILPSDLRPPKVLKRTLDYLFHDLLPLGGFSPTFNFIRDRSRAVRSDFTMQHITGPLAIECYDRCARFHIVALHFQRGDPSFSIPLEEQQLMNTLQSLKEFYQDQLGKYQSPTELEMRVYHRLIHIRDQKERHDGLPEHILSHPVFKLTTEFRLHVQKHSAPISKTSRLVVTDEGMHIFARLAAVLNEQGSTVMVYLVACILERLFGKDTIEDIESLRGDLNIPEIIDGISTSHIEEYTPDGVQMEDGADEMADDVDDQEVYYNAEVAENPQPIAPTPLKPTSPQWLSQSFPEPHASTASAYTVAATPVAGNAFASLVSQPNTFGTTNVFGNSVFSVSSAKPAASAFGDFSSSTRNAFGGVSFTTASTPPTASFSATQAGPIPSPSLTNSFAKTATFASTTTNAFGVNLAPIPSPITNAEDSTNDAETTKAMFPDQSKSDTVVHAGLFSSSASLPTSTSFTLNPKAPVFTPPKVSTPFIFPQQPLSTSSTFHVAPVSQTPFSNQSTTPSLHPPTPVNLEEAAPATTSPVPVIPPLSRPTAPQLLRIDTNTSSGSSSNPSPGLPPTPKIQPISLPSTPGIQPPNPLLLHLRSGLDPRGSLSPSSSKDILSPLVVGTPTTGNEKPLQNFSPLTTPQTSRVFQAPPLSTTNGKGKTVDRSMYDDIVEVEEMKKKALAFAQKGLLVKETFARWLKRAVDRAAWHEACRRGDEYRRKINSHNQHLHLSILRSSSGPETPPEKKRRKSVNGLDASPNKKRARRKVTTEYRPPRTDEELAKRFKENQQEQEHRWAQGSFLNITRKHLQTTSPSTLKLPWDVWISLNTEGDATAIWLERKFDIPDSGSWFSESVFAIPLSPARDSKIPGYPGMIVFESTPLGDVVDELERKYHILDDCSRLRELTNSLPTNRHFIPSLLVIHWAEDEASIAPDFLNMVKQLQSDLLIHAYHVFAVTATTKDLDVKLHKILTSMSFDTEGKLVQLLTPRSLFRAFEPTIVSFLNEWLENCNRNGHLDWSLYGQVIQASVAILDMLIYLVHSLLQVSAPEFLPSFEHVIVDDSESMYDSVMEWLSSFSSRDEAKTIAMDLQSHRNIGQEFPMHIFMEHLYELTQGRFEVLDPAATTATAFPRPVLTSDLNSAIESFKQEMQPHHMKLLQVYNFSARRSPKRRSYSVASSSSEQGSPEAKRPRLSASSSSSSNFGGDMTPMLVNGRNDSSSPTPSTVSGAQTDGSTITVSMLKALTRDLRRKYITS